MMTESEWVKFREFTKKLDLAETIIFIFIAIFTILGNTMVLAATWRERILHQPNKYFIVCLAVADLLVGIFVAPVKLYNYNIESRSVHLCRFIVWIDTIALTASIYSLMFISFDRYVKIRKPLQYRSTMTTSKSVKIIIIIWFISTAFASYAATPHSGSSGILVTRMDLCSYDDNKIKGFYTFLAVSAFFLPTVVILVMYSLIFIAVHKRQKMLRSGELSQTRNDQNQRSAFLQDLKAIRMLLIVVGVFILCWGPYFIYTLLVFYYPNFIELYSGSLNYMRRSVVVELVICTLPYFNSLCNPVIYAYLDQTYRDAFKNQFQRMMCRTSSRIPLSSRIPPNGPVRTR
jgi:hypothetical protein